MSSFLDPYRRAELTLSELTQAAGALLSRAPAGPADERVRAAPDGRTVRYYQSLCVVDRPLRYRGRQAIYGYRHLLQAVAVKLLQARGCSLAQVQDALRGAPTAQLEAAAVEGLGGTPPPAEAPPPGPIRPLTRRALISAELLPGLTVILDPERIEDPDALLRRLSRALSSP